MTLYELTQELFEYLVRFREKAPASDDLTFAQVRNDLIDIFNRMDAGARSDISLAAPYQQVRYALTALTDDILLHSKWNQAARWERECLELRFFGSENGAARFLEQAHSLGKAPKDVAAIYYLCLALGFRGELEPGDPELESLKDQLAARLPRSVRSKPPPQLQEYRPASLGLGVSHTPQTGNGLAPPLASKRPAVRVRPLWLGLGSALTVLIVAAWVWPPWGVDRQVPEKPLILKSPASSPVQGIKKSAPVKPVPPAKPTQEAPQTKTAGTKPPPIKEVTEPAGQTPKPMPNQRAAAKANPAEPKAVKPPAPKVKSVSQAAPKRGPEKPSPPPAAGPRYEIQVGVFVGPLQSGRLVKRFIKKGLPARLEKWSREGDKVWYAVMVGPFKGLPDAEKAQKTIAKEVKSKTFLRKIRPQ